MIETIAMRTTAFDNPSGEVLQGALWALLVVSALLTVRATWSGSWLTMWVAALTSLTASLIAIWSIGSLTFLLTCLQVAAAMALRRSAGVWRWLALLLAGLSAYGVLVFGLALARAADIWLIAIPLAFAGASLLVLRDLPLSRA